MLALLRLIIALAAAMPMLTGRGVTGYGRPVLTDATTGPLPRLRKFNIPISGPKRTITLRDGSIGFLLVHMIVWWHEVIEPINTGIWDLWGWAVRLVRGSLTKNSEHAGGCAADVRATKHPRGRATRATFTQHQIDQIHARLRFYDGVIGWGGDYHRTPDGMHLEAARERTLSDCERVARRLVDSPRGKRILAVNPGLREVIFS